MSSSQIFKSPFPQHLLFEFLEKFCLKTDRYYLFDQNAFKVMKAREYQVEFFTLLLPYYHLSKQFYITRECNYNSLTNILRQICKHTNTVFESTIKYSESMYGIDYHIFHSLLPPQPITTGSKHATPQGTPKNSPYNSPQMPNAKLL